MVKNSRDSLNRETSPILNCESSNNQTSINQHNRQKSKTEHISFFAKKKKLQAVDNNLLRALICGMDGSPLLHSNDFY
jgi:hypothetical protein